LPFSSLDARASTRKVVRKTTMSSGLSDVDEEAGSEEEVNVLLVVGVEVGTTV
jgi:hypothetical protein